MRRAACLIVLLCLLPATAAFAQSNPFQPIPPPPVQTPVPTVAVPTATPVNNDAFVDEDPSRGLLFGIAGAVAVLFVGIGIYITRDARKRLTDADRRALDRERAGAPREDLTPQQKQEAKRAKDRARQKGKAQRQARKAQRRR
jgi:hypothetical protein